MKKLGTRLMNTRDDCAHLVVTDQVFYNLHRIHCVRRVQTTLMKHAITCRKNNDTVGSSRNKISGSVISCVAICVRFLTY